MCFPHIAIDFVFVLDMVILYFLAIKFRWYAFVCNASSDMAIKIWSPAYSMVFTNFLLLSYVFYEDSKFLCSFLQCFVTFSALWSRYSFRESLAKQLPLAVTATTKRVPWSNISLSSIRETSSDQLWSLLHLISGICLKEEKKNSTSIHFASSLTYSKRLELRMLIDCTNIPAHWISLSALYSLFTNPKVGLGLVLARLIFPRTLKNYWELWRFVYDVVCLFCKKRDAVV